MRNKAEDLRDHLFATIEALRDEEDPLDVSRAKAVSEIAGRLIDMAKAETERMKVTGQTKSTDFLPPPEGRRELKAVK